jgi:putative Mg2+ transporter-C (MgtC) family protein
MISDTQVVLRLFLAAALGGIIGFEREKHNRRIAGLRTHILVSVGSALIMLVSIYVFYSYTGKTAVDPARIAAGVVTGIGFLGAGTIIRSGESVKGLTTAASLWTVSGIGLAVGCGFYIAGWATTIIALATLYLLRKIPIEDK